MQFFQAGIHRLCDHFDVGGISLELCGADGVTDFTGVERGGNDHGGLLFVDG